MSERPTPETDEARHDLSDYGSPVPHSWGDWIPVDVASKLERERDEAREERDKLQIMRNEVVAANKGAKINALVSNSLAGKLNKAELERDEANEELNKQLVRYDQLFDEAEKIRIERDEALMDRANGDIATMTINHYERILRERDEARESLKHIGEYGTEEINVAVELRQKLAKALIERDEAIRLLKLCAEYSLTTHQEQVEEFLKKTK